MSLYISIHTPREGSDIAIRHLSPEEFEFQSTLPVRGATSPGIEVGEGVKISIHTPREGSDVIHCCSMIS